MSKNLKFAIFVSGVITIVGAVLAFKESAWGNLIWLGLVLALGLGVVNVHGGGPHTMFRLVMWSGIFSFVMYAVAIYLVLNW
jgi:xanthine/uracil permease